MASPSPPPGPPPLIGNSAMRSISSPSGVSSRSSRGWQTGHAASASGLEPPIAAARPESRSSVIVETLPRLTASFSDPTLVQIECFGTPNGHRLQQRTTPSRVGRSRGSATGDEARCGTGRFLCEELACFRRLPSPSAMCSRKEEVYWQTTGELRERHSVSSFHKLPNGKGEFFNCARELSLSRSPSYDGLGEAGSDCGTSERSPSRQEEVLQEGRTATVLDRIYPRTGFVRTVSMGTEDGYSPAASRRSATNNSLQPLGRISSGSHPKASSSAAQPVSPNSTGNIGSGTKRKKEEAGAQRLLEFRQQLLDKFATMKNAFDQFVNQYGVAIYGKELTFKEFSRFLKKNCSTLPPETHLMVFEFLDIDGSGGVSLQEFHSAIEAIAPVQTIEDLRRKWIALGYHSMRKILFTLESNIDGWRRRLHLSEFGTMLKRVGITEEDEHQSIFQLIRDTNDVSNSVSLEQLYSAFASVSPVLLLEDIRDTLIKRYSTLERAFDALDMASSDRGNDNVPEKTFVKSAMTNWRMSSYEATKAFRLVDDNGNGSLSRTELLSALRASEASLFLEEVRKKVRQRFRSIAKAFRDDNADGVEMSRARQAGPGDEGTNRTPTKETSFTRGLFFQPRSMEQMQAVLASVQLTDSETAMLCEMVDINHDGKITPHEFSRGIKFFAPSCVLEDLRLQCTAQYGTVASAFANMSQQAREALMYAGELAKLLRSLNIDDGVDARSIVELIERSTGGIAVGELVAALQSGGPGVQVPLTSSERNAKARQEIRWHMAPFQRSASELRSEVRKKLSEVEDESRQHRLPITELDEECSGADDASALMSEDLMQSGTAGAAASSASPRHPRSPRSGPSASAAVRSSSYGGSPSVKLSGQRQTRTTLLRKGQGSSQSGSFRADTPTKQSYSKVSRCVRVLPKEDSTRIVDRLYTYYSSAGNTVSENQELLSTSQSRLTHFKMDKRHKAVLEQTWPQGR